MSSFVNILTAESGGGDLTMTRRQLNLRRSLDKEETKTNPLRRMLEKVQSEIKRNQPKLQHLFVESLTWGGSGKYRSDWPDHTEFPVEIAPNPILPKSETRFARFSSRQIPVQPLFMSNLCHRPIECPFFEIEDPSSPLPPPPSPPPIYCDDLIPTTASSTDSI